RRARHHDAGRAHSRGRTTVAHAGPGSPRADPGRRLHVERRPDPRLLPPGRGRRGASRQDSDHDPHRFGSPRLVPRASEQRGWRELSDVDESGPSKPRGGAGERTRGPAPPGPPRRAAARAAAGLVVTGFDQVVCEYPLSDPRDQDREFLTRDFGGWGRDRYVITRDGRLI